MTPQRVPPPPSPALDAAAVVPRSPTRYSQPGPSTSRNVPEQATDEPRIVPRQGSITTRNDRATPSLPNTPIIGSPLVNPNTPTIPSTSVIPTTPPVPTTPTILLTPNQPTTPIDLTTSPDPKTPTTPAMPALSTEAATQPEPVKPGEAMIPTVKKMKDGKRNRGPDPTRSNSLLVNVDRNTADIAAIRAEISNIRTDVARMRELLERIAPSSPLGSDNDDEMHR